MSVNGSTTALEIEFYPSLCYSNIMYMWLEFSPTRQDVTIIFIVQSNPCKASTLGEMEAGGFIGVGCLIHAGACVL